MFEGKRLVYQHLPRKIVTARNQPPLQGQSEFQQDPDNIIAFQVDRDPEADDRLTLPTYT